MEEGREKERVRKNDKEKRHLKEKRKRGKEEGLEGGSKGVMET